MEGKEDYFRLRAKAQWHHKHDVVRETAFRPTRWSSLNRKLYGGWRWEERLNPDQREPAEEIDFHSVGSGRAPKIWEQE